MFKAEKGITLVALIITIIVLLILAGVVISMTIGNDGIITKSEYAVNKYNEAATSENEAITTFEKQVDAYYANATKVNPNT